MKAGKIVACVFVGVLQLAAMSICGFFFKPVTAAFICYLLFLFFGGIITAIVLSGYDNKRAKLGAVCVFIGLIGIAVMHLCTFLIYPPFSGIIGFIVFVIFAAIIAMIILVNKKEFINESAYSIHENVKCESARRMVKILRSRGVPDTEICLTIMETFRLRKEIIEEIMQSQ